MTDPKTLNEMREVVKRVEDRAKKDNVGLYRAFELEGISKTTYYTYKDRLEREKLTIQTQEIRTEPPEYPRISPEEIAMPEKQKKE